ncbi:LON peptidase N-terminal domain and RING finger protein 2 isoform X3 [Castor canadensis]|uniref:LON peptidase N-terminal domain and RING finger protein 2 isoform X3 n=1 Tax=Castor canadensis TaxID=51338 RepID=A0AC58KNF5_CASCN
MLPHRGAPDDSSLLLLRAEFCLIMKNYEQALQDAHVVCQKEPLLTKGVLGSRWQAWKLGHGLQETVYVRGNAPPCLGRHGILTDSDGLSLSLDLYYYRGSMFHQPHTCYFCPSLGGHHLKAQALSGLGRSKEVLKEFIYCLALNPECNSAKKETQKVLCEVFFPASESMNQNLASSTQSRLKAQCDSQTNAQSPVEEDGSTGSSENPSEKSDVFRSANSSVLYFILGLHFEEDKKALEHVIPVAPSSSLKRQLPNDMEDAQDLNTPGKIPKKDADSSPQRNMNSKIGEDSEELLIDATDFECALCMRLLFEPVTTPCGHMFCLKCLERCLDHAPHCPLCKDKLSELLATRNFNITILAEELIFQYLPDELSDRKRIYDEEMSELSNLTRDVPIFVCAMAFPTVPCPLHVFEPRYRLMIRRCMETGTKRFGMCLSAEHAGISEYGCMLEIKDVRTFPDGSSVVDAIGISRFRVLSHRHRDGYNTADIEYLEDEKVEGPEYEELTALHDSVYQQSVSWFTSLQDHMKEQILSHFGLMPDREPEPQSNPSGPAWSWWILAVLPLERKAQLAILGMTSLKERLLAIRRILVIITRKMNNRQELANNRERNN